MKSWVGSDPIGPASSLDEEVAGVRTQRAGRVRTNKVAVCKPRRASGGPRAAVGVKYVSIVEATQSVVLC